MHAPGAPSPVDPSTYMHAVVVLVVVLCATALRAAGELDVATLSTVYGAALGYATGLTVGRKQTSNGEG